VQYDGGRLLVVGGGDSALEAAVALAERPGTTVTLSYHGPVFSRARQANRERLQSAERRDRVAVLLESRVVQIGVADVTIEQAGVRQVRPNDAVIVCAGGILPTQFLRGIGIEVETKYGTA
jgi:thioredoxin reductase